MSYACSLQEQPFEAGVLVSSTCVKLLNEAKRCASAAGSAESCHVPFPTCLRNATSAATAVPAVTQAAPVGESYAEFGALTKNWMTSMHPK
jgi:hypothetical protein